jgi:Sec-independent protein translocase protein TatA
MGKAIKEFRTTQKNELDSSDEENEVDGSRKS